FSVFSSNLRVLRVTALDPGIEILLLFFVFFAASWLSCDRDYRSGMRSDARAVGVARQAHGEHGTAAGAVVGADAAAVLLDDLLGDGEAEAGAALLARRVRFEPALVESRRQSGAVVGDAELYPEPAVVPDLARRHLDARLALGGHRLERIL